MRHHPGLNSPASSSKCAKGGYMHRPRPASGAKSWPRSRSGTWKNMAGSLCRSQSALLALVISKFYPANSVGPKSPIFIKIIIIAIIIFFTALIVMPMHLRAIRVDAPSINRAVICICLEMVICSYHNIAPANHAGMPLSSDQISKCENSHFAPFARAKNTCNRHPCQLSCS